MEYDKGHKPIVYLDQNWLSNITKAHTGAGTDIDRDYYLELSNVIQQGVALDRFVCPTSFFHKNESTLSIQFSADFLSVADTLSRKLSFNSYIKVSHHQLLRAASVFSGSAIPPDAWWSIPFNRDPDIASCMMPPMPRLQVFVTNSAAKNDEIRTDKNQVATIYQDYKELRNSQNLSYIKELHFNKHQWFWEAYVVVARSHPLFGNPPLVLDPFSSEIAAADSLSRLIELFQVCMNLDGYKRFLESNEFLEVPFISIRAKLMAGDIVYERHRIPEPSLLEDFDIAATVLPYSDVFATENYLAELIKKTKVGDDYRCRVFTMRQKQGLLEHLSML